MIVTDLNKTNQTDLVLSSRAFRAMAKPVVGADRDLLKQGIVDIEYRRFDSRTIYVMLAFLIFLQVASSNKNY